MLASVAPRVHIAAGYSCALSRACDLCREVVGLGADVTDLQVAKLSAIFPHLLQLQLQ